jgi:long-chain acyl-CoA synthetase
MREMVYPRLLLQALEDRGDTVTFVEGELRETLAVHADRSLRMAEAHRRHLGLASTDPFAILAANSVRYINAWHAAFLGGGIINPLNTRLAPAELAFILADSGSKAIYVDATFAPVIESIRHELPDLRHVIDIDSAAFDDMLASVEPVVPDEPEEDDLAVLMYTGGTTGRPKGVLHTQRSQMFNVYRLGFMFELFRHPGVFLQCTPMFHAAGCLGTLGIPVSGGVDVVQKMFEPGAAIAAIEEHGVTILGLVPTMIQMMFDHPSFSPEKFASVRTLGYGAAPMPAGLLRRILDQLPHVDVLQTYGMTEASAVVTMLSPGDHEVGGPRLKSAGRAVAGVRMRIVDPDDNPVPRGTAGEVCAMSGSFMVGYHNRPEETAKALKGGWYHTGDVGYMDDEGYLFLVDRAKDMIVTGAENVYSTEVENVLSTHPAVAQVAVIGIPSEKWGEQVHAIVVVRPDHTVTAEELIAHCRTELAGYKVPKSVELRDTPLPLSGAMKILKRELRAPYWAGHDRMIG